MDKLFILAKVEEYFKEEYNNLIKLLNDDDFCNQISISKRDLIYRSRAGLFHISMFAQKLDIDFFDELNSIYEKYYDKYHILLLTF